ncbi:hypothetical protein HO173_003364 [Letharia columbiana]|uniref:Piwi domain-containing protein n=1 Tax=Letharia columbiana TaxID=112416 RepID=A0A8H6G116_9LECA|nr:uncharacterized protein HO173_003364 [Letharia columbiana]KAF6238397.1 hypothetical protein HO173_003364 [Letharia columbiana]
MPKIAIIIVGKHHHTRFHPATKGKADTVSDWNPPNSTVVDRGITMERRWDFETQAHAALEGTVSDRSIPAFYDQVERLTHWLCRLYCRATKAASICPPAYHADRICARGRCFLNECLDREWPKDQKFQIKMALWTQGVHEE